MAPSETSWSERSWKPASEEYRRSALRYLRRIRPRTKIEKENIKLLTKILDGPSCGDVDDMYPEGAPFDGVVFYHNMWFVRIVSGRAAGEFAEVCKTDLSGLDASIIERAKRSFMEYDDGLVENKQKLLRCVPLGTGSATPHNASAQSSLNVNDGPSLLANSVCLFREEVASSAYVDVDGHCLPGAILKLLYDFPELQKQLESAFYDKTKKTMLDKEIGPWLQSARSETHHVEFHKIKNNNTPSSLLDFQNHATGTGDKYFVCLRLKNGAGHAISLDYVGEGRIYDSAGGFYDGANLQGGLRALLESGAKVESAGKLVVVERNGKTRRRGKKRPRSE